MKIREIILELDQLAPFELQEDYDNSGLIIGSPDSDVGGCLLCVDVSEKVIDEAIQKNFGLIISHHPVIFKSLRRLTGHSLTERIVIKAIQEGVSIISMHTNLDNSIAGVNVALCREIGLTGLSILKKAEGKLRKLVTFCPGDHADEVREAIFRAGAGHIGNYEKCSFNSEGTGTFLAGEKANPYVGRIGEIHKESEIRIETVFPCYLEKEVIGSMLEAHPYEEVAYDIYTIENEFISAGAGMIGSFEEKLTEIEFLDRLKRCLKVPVIRHSPLRGVLVKTVAVCGGSGSFLLSDAIRQNADFFVTADVKYHQFFDAGERIVITDAGHFETEQFACNILADHLKKKFANFAVQISETPVNPVNYF